MVHLILSTTKGNSSSRHFPFQGYLGLTPVRVDGVVCTRFDEDQKPILAKSLTVSVRAYEARQGRGGPQHSRLLVDYSQTLWRKPDGQEYAELGELDRSFKITLPKRVAGFSTANFLDYRLYWRLEAVLEHASMASVGSRLLKHFDLMLIRYDTPPPLPSPSIAALPFPQTILSHATNKPRAPVLHYNLSTPTHPIGPSDLLFTSVFIQPLDPSVSIRSASLLVERRIDLHEIDTPMASTSSSVPPFSYQSPPPISLSNSAPESDEGRKYLYANEGIHDLASRSTATIDSSASNATINSRTPLISSTRTETSSSSEDCSSQPPISPVSPATVLEPIQPNKTLASTVAAAEGASFALDKETGVWSKTISFPWPASRSHWKWAMGESMRGGLGAVTFWIRVKVIVTSPAGTESIDLAPREILVVLTNDADRRQAQARYAEARATSKCRASSSPAGQPTISSQSTSTADVDTSVGVDPPEKNSPVYFHYAPPKSAEVPSRSPLPSVSSMPASRHSPPTTAGPSPSTEQAVASSSGRSASVSALATFSKVLPTKKKSRRPHTSAGPRDSVDVQVGGTIPVPVPVPSVGGYTSSSSSSSHDSPPSFISRHRRQTSSGKRKMGRSPDLGTSSSTDSHSLPPPPTPPLSRLMSDPEECAYKTLNTNFTGLNGIGGPGAMALVWNQHQQRLEAEEREREEKSRELVRAWEEELALIEKASKRESSTMLGFLGALGRKKAKAVHATATVAS